MATKTHVVGPTPTLAVQEGVGWVTFDDPGRGLNILTEDVMRDLAEIAGELHERAARGSLFGVIVQSGKKGSFIAGADVSAIEAIADPSLGQEASRLGQAVFEQIERLPVPTVAAIDGLCLGGGTELSLACRYRVASDSSATRIGLPEVQLGILPAWGGTIRLSRLVGLRRALGLLLTGKSLPSARAHRLGLVDAVFPRELFREKVSSFLHGRVREGGASAPKRRTSPLRILEDSRLGRRIVIGKARRAVESRTGGHYPAPLKILEVLRRSAGRSPEKGFRLEAEAAGELIASRVSKNLIHLFHLRNGSRKGTGIEGDAQPRDVASLGVLGAGVMGGGIAQLAAYSGIRVRIKDIAHPAVAGALAHARSLFDRAVRKRKLGRRAAAQRMESISGGLDYSGFGSVDVVVEAVVERMEVKRSVLAETEALVPDDCILATNTSSLSVDEMAEGLSRPEKLCGMHFFNPVHRMPLVEVVRGLRTDDIAVATIHALALKLRKSPIVVRDGPGFLVNRILGPYLNEAGHLLADGASVRDIDSVATDFGMPMGPCRLIDEIGIDVARHAGESLHEALGERLAPSPALVSVGTSGRLGKKGGVGFYRYESGRARGVDETVYELVGESVPRGGGQIDPQVIRARLLLMMVNEAAYLLEEGIVSSAGDVDLGMVMGTGFPPFRGGLLRHADRMRPRTILDRLEEYERTLGMRFRPAPLVRRLAAEDLGFYGLFP